MGVGSGGLSGALRGVGPGVVLLERYRVTENLGAGGYGFVVAAFDQALQRDVAIKFLHPTRTTARETESRFLLEAKMCASLVSDHVVRIHAVEDTVYGGCIVMERLRGEDLAAALRRDRVLPVATVIRYALEA